MANYDHINMNSKKIVEEEDTYNKLGQAPVEEENEYAMPEKGYQNVASFDANTLKIRKSNDVKAKGSLSHEEDETYAVASDGNGCTAATNSMLKGKQTDERSALTSYALPSEQAVKTNKEENKWNKIKSGAILVAFPFAICALFIAIYVLIQTLNRGESEIKDPQLSMTSQMQRELNNLKMDNRKLASQLTYNLTALANAFNGNAYRTEVLENRTVQLSYVEKGWYVPLRAYFLTNVTRTYFESRRLCQEQGADLAAYGMRDNKLRESISKRLSGQVETFVWIGLSDRIIEGTYLWVDGVKANQSIQWGSNEPDGNDEDCGQIYLSRSSIFDWNCFRKRYAICEKIV